jgi:DNA-binding PadR family transcriptional regulator
MDVRDGTLKYLPLSEATYYIMLVLAKPMHGYAIMQRVEDLSEGMVKLGPGTLYGALATLQKQGLIAKAGQADRRKSYILTALGMDVLLQQVRRLELMSRNGLSVIDAWI